MRGEYGPETQVGGGAARRRPADDLLPDLLDLDPELADLLDMAPPEPLFVTEPEPDLPPADPFDLAISELDLFESPVAPPEADEPPLSTLAPSLFTPGPAIDELVTAPPEPADAADAAEPAEPAEPEEPAEPLEPAGPAEPMSPTEASGDTDTQAGTSAAPEAVPSTLVVASEARRADRDDPAPAADPTATQAIDSMDAVDDDLPPEWPAIVEEPTRMVEWDAPWDGFGEPIAVALDDEPIGSSFDDGDGDGDGGAAADVEALSALIVEPDHNLALLAPTPCPPVPTANGAGARARMAPCADGPASPRPPAARPRRGPLAAVLAALVLVAAAGGAALWLTGSPREERAPEPTTVVPADLDPTTSIVAQAALPIVDVYRTPGEPRPVQSLDNPTDVGVGLVFLVESEQGTWLKVRLPNGPAGSTGWVKTSQVTLSRHAFRIVIRKAAHRLELFKGRHLELRTSIAEGTRDFPRPGAYYVKELLKPPDPRSVYGDFAYGLSGADNSLDGFTKEDGVVAIHGSNNPDSLGHDTPTGSIGLSASAIRQMVGTVPLGTPVEIQP